MKKVLFFAACFMALVACNNEKTGSNLPQVSQTDSLQKIIEQKDNEINDMMGILNDIDEGFRLINEAENRVSVAKDGEVYAYSFHISPYDHGNIFNRDPDRPKRLLLHKREIRKLHDLQKQEGYALIPLSVYFKNSRVKVELGLCKGKKTYDKREAVAKRDAKREMDRAMREKNRGY